MEVGKPSKIRIIPTGSLFESINNIEFILSIYKEKEFYIGDVKIPLKDVGNIDINKYLESLRNFLEVKEVLNILGEKHDLNCSNLSQEELKRLQLVADSVLHQKKVTIRMESNTDIFSLVKIGELNILYWGENVGENKYIVKNFFGVNRFFALFQEENLETPHRVTKYLHLTRSFLEDATNLDYCAIIEDLNVCEKSVIVTEQLTLFVLEVLHAYDNKAKKGINDVGLLDIAEAYCNWVNDNCENYTAGHRINELQISKRKRLLTDDEKLELTDIRKKSSNQTIKCAANILLDRHDSAQDCFDEMSDEDKKLFYSYPISNLGKLIF